MKKIIRGIVLGVLAVIVIAGSVGAYFLFGQKGPAKDSKLIMTDAKGNSYLAMVDEKSGETLFAVTDANGKVYAAVTDANGNVGETVGNVDDVVNISDLPTNYSGPSKKAADILQYGMRSIYRFSFLWSLCYPDSPPKLKLRFALCFPPRGQSFWCRRREPVRWW